MQAFSNSLVDMYEAAETLSIADFPSELLSLIKTQIPFDGAVLGVGGRTATDQNLVIDDAHIADRDQSILADYASVSEGDPITQRFVAGLDAPLKVSCPAFYKERNLDALQQFAKRHCIEQLMLHGNKVSVDENAKWLVLYRSSNETFSTAQALRFRALWPHISRALAINRIATIDATRDAGKEGAIALINSAGGIEFSDLSFRSLVALEWNIHPLRKLPGPVFKAACSRPLYCGRYIRIDTTVVHGFYVCRAAPLTTVAGLSRSESLVATCYAQGLTYKEIGRRLDLSQNTVRVHLANCYRKLGVHNKVALSKRLSE